MMWGHTAATADGPIEVTYAEQMEAFGLEPPDKPEVPECAIHVYTLFWELNARRQAGFEQLNPISFTEVSSWLNLTGYLLTPEEIRWLMVMDDAWMAAIAKERQAKQERDREAAESKQKKRKR